MNPSDSWQLIVLVILLSFSAFFSASETALMTLSKIRIRHLVDENVKGAGRIKELLDNPSKLLGAILVGNNVVNIGASALMTSLFISSFGEAGVGIATAVMTVVVLIFGEITPKTLAAQNSEKFAFAVARPIAMIVYILTPIITVLTAITNGVVRLLGGKTNTKQISITEDELKTIVNVSHEEGVLEKEERKMIHNVFEFGDRKAKDVMTPRTDMVSIDVTEPYEKVLQMFEEEEFSRVPVHEGSFDNIIGLITLKDFIFKAKNTPDFSLEKLARKPFFTYEYKLTSELLSEMRVARAQMAIVLDEYGGTAGIITIEDLIEEIVGDIDDEYDEVEKNIEVIKEDEYVVEGSTRIEDINELLGTHLESLQIDTIGGYVTTLFGTLPGPGDTIEEGSNRFIIEQVDKNRVEKLRIFTSILKEEE